MIAYTAAQYGRDHHESFVMSAWVRSARLSPADIHAMVRHVDTSIVVAHSPGDADSLMGFAAVSRGAVLWVYVRRLYGKLRRQGLGTALLLETGVVPSEATPARFWSPTVAEIVAAGKWALYYQPKHKGDTHAS